MKNLKQNLVDFRGMTLVDKNEKDEEIPISLHFVAINSLLMTGQEELSLTGVEKVRRFTLAQNIYQDPEHVELSKEDTELLKTLIGKYAPIMVAGCAWALLDKEN